MKAKSLVSLLLVPFSCLAVSCGEERLEKKENVISLFQTKGNRDDGDLRFRDLDLSPTVSTLKTFVYSPVYDSFNCSCLIATTESEETTYEYGSMSFYRGSQEDAVFAGRKEIREKGSIAFLFTPQKQRERQHL